MSEGNEQIERRSPRKGTPTNSPEAEEQGDQQIGTRIAQISHLSERLREQSGRDKVMLNDENFDQEVLKEKGWVLVVFSAPSYCKPCQEMAPTVNMLATRYKGAMKVGEYDTDAKNNETTKEAYNISTIPFIILFRNGVPQFAHQGAMSQTQLLELLKANNIAKKAA